MIYVDDGGHATLRNIEIAGADIGVDVAEGGSLDISNSVIHNNHTAGTRVRGGSISGQELSLSRNGVNLDLRQGARGDLFDSNFAYPDHYDIRYDEDVLFGLYNTEAGQVHDLARSRTNPDIGANSILDTTPEQLWAENKIAKAKAAGKVTFGVGIGQALQML